MENLVKFIKQLDDRLFANFYHYRRLEFMPESQKLIEAEKIDRNLSHENILSCINLKSKVNNGCVRCSSQLKFEEIDKILIQTEAGNFEKEIHSWKCLVCGYNPYKHKAINLKAWIKKKLGFYHWSKISTV